MREFYHQIYNIIFSKLVLLPILSISIVHSGQETLIATVCMHGHMHNLWFSIAWFVSILHVCLLMFTSFALKLMFFNLSQCTVSRAVCALHTDQCRLICIKKFLRLGIYVKRPHWFRWFLEVDIT